MEFLSRKVKSNSQIDTRQMNGAESVQKNKR